MKTYIAYLKQDGEGCDYTIGCGRTVIDIEAANMEEATNKLVEKIKEEYSYEEGRLKSAVLYEVLQLHMLDTKELYKRIDNSQYERESAEKEEKERQEFERLKAKFGN